jgi:hypothetical protein
MKFAGAFSLHNGDAEWDRRDLKEWLTDLFEAPTIQIGARCTSAIRSHLRTELTNAGWASNVRINSAYDLTVTGMSDDLAFQIQTGNISRAMYDLLKLEYLYKEEKIAAAALALPTRAAADAIASNVAHVERVWGELQLLHHIINVPLLLVSFE